MDARYTLLASLMIIVSVQGIQVAFLERSYFHTVKQRGEHITTKHPHSNLNLIYTANCCFLKNPEQPSPKGFQKWLFLHYNMFLELQVFHFYEMTSREWKPLMVILCPHRIRFLHLFQGNTPCIGKDFCKLRSAGLNAVTNYALWWLINIVSSRNIEDQCQNNRANRCFIVFK